MAIQWRVLYRDGTIEEGYDNLSKNAYNNPNVIYFSLFANNCRYSVNLENGTIELNHIEILSPFLNATYRLVYYRLCEQIINYPEYSEMPYIGWQTTIGDKNYKVIYGITTNNKIIQKVE